MEKVDLLIEEYKTLRNEVLTAMNNRNNVLSIGISINSLIFTTCSVISTSYKNNLHITYLLLEILPVINIFILYIWLGEYERMQRAGKFICLLEKKINEIFDEQIMTWETHLREKKSNKNKHMKAPYNSVVFLITFLNLISILYATIIYDRSGMEVKYKYMLILFSVLMVVFTSYSVMNKINKLKN